MSTGNPAADHEALIEQWRSAVAEQKRAADRAAQIPPPDMGDGPVRDGVLHAHHERDQAEADTLTATEHSIRAHLLAAHQRATGDDGAALRDAIRTGTIDRHRRVTARTLADARARERRTRDRITAVMADHATLYRRRAHHARITLAAATLAAVASAIAWAAGSSLALVAAVLFALTTVVSIIGGVLADSDIPATSTLLAGLQAAAVEQHTDRLAAEIALLAAGGNPDTDPAAQDPGGPPSASLDRPGTQAP